MINPWLRYAVIAVALLMIFSASPMCLWRWKARPLLPGSLRHWPTKGNHGLFQPYSSAEPGNKKPEYPGPGKGRRDISFHQPALSLHRQDCHEQCLITRLRLPLKKNCPSRRSLQKNQLASSRIALQPQPGLPQKATWLNLQTPDGKRREN